MARFTPDYAGQLLPALLFSGLVTAGRLQDQARQAYGRMRRAGNNAAFRLAASPVWCTRRLLLLPGVPFLEQPFELFILLIDTASDAFFGPFTGSAGGLFDQLPDVVLKDRDPIVEFGQR
jgi:hypothetical protein